MSRILVLDTETTGHYDEQAKPEVIELAYSSLSFPEMGLFEPFQARFRPISAITYGAMAVHHIIPSDLVDCPSSKEAKLPADTSMLIGHNIDYDWEALGSPDGVRRICTLAISRALFPELDGHSLGAMTYWFARDKAKARELLRGAHSASVDVSIAYELFANLLEYMKVHQSRVFSTIDQVWEWAENCRIPVVWSFGKHKGQPIKGTDRGYLNWCLRQLDMDPYVKKACARELER